MARKETIEELSFTYHGVAVDDGSMDMVDFGKALIGYAQAVSTVVVTLDSQAHVPDIRITRTERGSFTVFAQISQDVTLLESLFDFLGTSTANKMAVGAEIAGGVGLVGGAFIAAIRLCRKIGGKAIRSRKIISEATGEEEATLSDGQKVTGNINIFNIVVNNSFNSGARAFLEPTSRDGVDSVSVSAGRETETLKSEDLHCFPVRDADIDVSQVTSCELVLAVERVSFDDGNWRFTQFFDDDRVPVSFNAIMMDADFTCNVEAGRIAFRKGDQLRVLLEETVRKPEGGRQTRLRRIVRVFNVIPYIPPSPLPGFESE